MNFLYDENNEKTADLLLFDSYSFSGGKYNKALPSFQVAGNYNLKREAGRDKRTSAHGDDRKKHKKKGPHGPQKPDTHSQFVPHLHIRP